MRAKEPWRGGVIGSALTGFDGKDEQGKPAAEAVARTADAPRGK